MSNHPVDTPEHRAVPAGWVRLPPGHLPAPTFWPAGLALGMTFLVWGLITSWVVILAGAIVFGGSLVGWIVEIRHERHDTH